MKRIKKVSMVLEYTDGSFTEPILAEDYEEAITFLNKEWDREIEMPDVDPLQ